MKKEINGISIELVLGDISNQADVEAVVNAANAALLPGGGVAGAIHRRAGPGLADACRKLAPIKPGQAVITRAFNLPNTHVIHCLGPVYGKDNPSDVLLGGCYIDALKLAEDNQVRSIAFCAISTGIFAYPVADALNVAFEAVLKSLPGLESLKTIRFVFHTLQTLEIAKEILKRNLK